MVNRAKPESRLRLPQFRGALLFSQYGLHGVGHLADVVDNFGVVTKPKSKSKWSSY